MIHRTNIVTTLNDFIKAICPKGDITTIQEILEMIKQHKLRYGTITKLRDEHKINEGAFHFTIQRLKDLGIMTKDWRFSSKFQSKLLALSQFYANYTGQQTEYQEVLDEANKTIKQLWEDTDREKGKPKAGEPIKYRIRIRKEED